MMEFIAQIESVSALAWIAAVSMIGSIGFATQRWLNSPKNRHRRQALKLFYELCNAHRLDHRAVSTLFALIRGHQLEHPALIFLRPDLFLAEKVPSKLQPRIDDIKKLRRQLFVSSSEA